MLFFKPAGSEERGGYGGVKLVALDLSKHPSYRSLLRFDGPDWRHHLASLKPLGLCSVLNSTCRHDDCGEMVNTQLQVFIRPVIYMIYASQQLQVASACTRAQKREREREREASRRLIYLSARSNQPNEIDLKVYS